MVRAAIGGRSSLGRGEEDEAFSPRGALVGLGAGSVLLWWVLLLLSLLLLLLFLLLFLLLLL